MRELGPRPRAASLRPGFAPGDSSNAAGFVALLPPPYTARGAGRLGHAAVLWKHALSSSFHLSGARALQRALVPSRIWRGTPAAPAFFASGALAQRAVVLRSSGRVRASAEPAPPAAPRRRGRPRKKRPPSEAEAFLASELGMSRADVDRCVAAFPGLARLSVDGALRPAADALAAAGLPPPALAAALPASPRVLAMGPDRIRRKVAVMRDAGLDADEAAAVLRRDLHVLWVREETMRERLAFAREHFGVEPARLLRSTRTVGASEAAMASAAASLERAGLDPSAVRRLIARQPKLLALAGNGRLESLAAFLHAELALDPAAVVRMLQRQPMLLGMRIDTLSERVSFFAEMGLSRAEMAAVVTRYPSLLCRSLEGTFEPTVEFLSGLGLQGPAVAKVLARAPMAFLRPLDGGLRPAVAALAAHAALSRHDLAQVIVKFPQLLARSRTGLERSLRYLKSRGFRGADLSSLVRASPQVLVLDPAANLEPKIRLLRSHGYGPDEIVRFPPALAYSLPSRIRPRLEYLRALREANAVAPRGEACPLPPPVSLSSALSPSDAAFAARVARTSADEYASFRSFLRPAEEAPVPLEDLDLEPQAPEGEGRAVRRGRRGWPRRADADPPE